MPRRRRNAGSHSHIRPSGVASIATIVKGGHSHGKQDRDAPLHQVVSSQDRLVDICVRLMSSEHTCQHSDHAMGRCLLYGADAVYSNVVCESLVPLETVPSHIPLGMCFMAQECDVQRHVTCHRYLPSGKPLMAEVGSDGRSTDVAKDDEVVRRAMQLTAKVNFRSALKRGARKGSGSGSGSGGGGKVVEVDYSREVNNEALLELTRYLASGSSQGKGNPARKFDKSSNFRVFSSAWDGNITDTH